MQRPRNKNEAGVRMLSHKNTADTGKWHQCLGFAGLETAEVEQPNCTSDSMGT